MANHRRPPAVALLNTSEDLVDLLRTHSTGHSAVAAQVREYQHQCRPVAAGGGTDERVIEIVGKPYDLGELTDTVRPAVRARLTRD
jgi:hypothetical protein